MASKSKYKGGNFFIPHQKVQIKTEARSHDQENDIALKEMKDCIMALKSQIEQMNVKIGSLENVVQEKYDKTAKEIVRVCNVLSDALLLVDSKIQDVEVFTKKLDEKINQVDLKVKEVDNLALNLENDVIMLQYRSMENALRLRGIPERSKEDLVQICSKALAKLLQIEEGKIVHSITKIYRVNSRIAKQRNLPRDVVIYLTDINMRNDIAARSFFSKVHIEGKQIIVFKEIPSKILRSRKEFRFLAVELKKRSVLFRWEAPVGMSLNYGGQYYKLNTIEEAKAFYSDVLKVVNTSSSSRSVLETREEKKLEESSDFLQELEEKLVQQDGENLTAESGAPDGEESLESLEEIQLGTAGGEESLEEFKSELKSFWKSNVRNQVQQKKFEEQWQKIFGS